MQYRLDFHNDAWGPDLDRFSDAERKRIHDELASWVPGGPPDDDPLKKYSQFVEYEVFEHETSGIIVVYQILEYDDENACIEVKRIRRKLPGWL